jgi:hypothetical protein
MISGSPLGKSQPNAYPSKKEPCNKAERVTGRTKLQGVTENLLTRGCCA